MANAGPRGGSEGEQLGPYRLVRKLGRGGMGEVWLAEHETIKSQVAIKLVLAAPDDEEAASRFLREAKATARIRHPGVVNVTDFGPRSAGGAYLVMELLDGESLAERLERGALPVDLAIDLGVQIAEALAAAHASGVVHRDLKPANIFLVRDAATRSDVRVKLVDFGVAKATGKVTDELGVTVTGALVGTPVYMAPEQCTTRKGPVDHRADLYALGVVLYEVLTGKPPFRGPTLGDLIDQHLNESPISPRTIAPAIPSKLDVLIMTLLAKDSADRPPSANDVARVLHELRGTTPSAQSLDETMASGSRPPVTTDPSVDETIASGAVPASKAVPADAKPAVTNIDPEPRPVPKALIWGLAGGFLLFCAILVVIVVGRERTDVAAPPMDPAAACEKGDPAACLTLADREMMQRKPDLPRIATWVQSACNRGNQRACVRFADMLVWGTGVAADQARAFTLAKTACEQNDGDGCDLAGALVPASPDRPRLAFDYYLRACELGAAGGCSSAGRRYRYGLGVKADPVRAKELLGKSNVIATKACEANDAAACRQLGVNLVRGDGIKKNEALAFAKLQRACDLGNAYACGETGEQLALGADGLQKDPDRARANLELGCDRGAAHACMTLGIAHAYGLVGPADASKGFELVKAACVRTPSACSVAGDFYSTGTGTPKDKLLAANAYKRGCDANDADACAQYALLSTKDQTEKRELLERACNLGSGNACKLVADRLRSSAEFTKAAEMYELACALSDQFIGCNELATAHLEGRGIPQNVERGRQILEDGCKHGSPSTCHALGARLRDGDGFKADAAEAVRHLDLACDLGWGQGCLDGADMREKPIYGIAQDAKRAAELRKRGCAIDPPLCAKKKTQASESRSESPPQ